MDNNSNGNPGRGNSTGKSWEEMSSWFEAKKEEISTGRPAPVPEPQPGAEEPVREKSGSLDGERMSYPARKKPAKKATVRKITDKKEQPQEPAPRVRVVSGGAKKGKKGGKRPSAGTAKRGNGKNASSCGRGRPTDRTYMGYGAGKEQPSNDENRREESEKKKEKKKKNRVINSVTAAVVVVVIGLVLCMFFAFKTSDFTVEGKTQYTEDEIITASGIEAGDYVWKINKKEVNRDVCERLPYVGSVKVSVRLPSTVKLTVTPAKEKYAIKFSKNYVVISDLGKVLSRTEKKVPKGAVELTGISFADAINGEQIVYSDGNEEKIKIVDDLIENAAVVGVEPITAVIIENATSIYAVYDSRVKLYFGNQSDMDSKLRSCKAMIDRLSAEKSKFTGVANLSNKGKVYFLPGSMDAEITSSKKYELKMTQK